MAEKINKVRRPREEVEQAVRQIQGGCWDITVAGSYRREKATVGDLDVLVGPEHDFGEMVEWCETMFGYEQVRGGAMKSEGICPDYKGQPLVLNLWRVPQDSAWGAMMLFCTGPYDFNIMMRAKAQVRGWKLSQYGLFAPNDAGEDSSQIDVGYMAAVSPEEWEKDIFDNLELEYLTPVQRERWRDYLLKTKVKADMGRTVNVASSRPGHAPHQVRLEMQEGKWTAVECECEHFTYRKKTCRHMREAEKVASSA